MQIQNAIAHRVLKQRNAKGASTQPADSELERTDELRELMGNLLESYNNRSSRFTGSFEIDEENYRFSVALRSLVKGEIDFLSFSMLALERLRVKIDEVTFAGGGYLLIVRYSVHDRDMLLVAKLNAQAGAIFSEDLHRVVRASYLNLDRLQVAARIDIGAWLNGEERYLTFVLKRDKDEGPSDYFQSFVGCRVDQDSKVETKKLVRVVKDFATKLIDEGQISAESVPEVQRRAYDYVEAVRKGEEPRVDDFLPLANAIWPDEPASFLAFLNGHDDPPSAGFVPDGATIKRLSNIDFKSRDLTVKMTYEFKQGHVRIQGDRVIIEDAPPKLLSELS